jgi:ribosomal protein L11 methyltransferase
MKREFLIIRFHLPEEDPRREELVARLALLGFDGFAEETDHLLASAAANTFTDEARNEVAEMAAQYDIEWESERIPDQNWNAQWEASYPDVWIDERLRIRAPFHSSLPGPALELIIEPKMSFGTAHHPTTFLMLKLLLDLNVTGKKVLDMGAGTAVLAILASLKGAAGVNAIDNDSWAYENALENVSRNPGARVEVELGDARLLTGRSFDVILANINRNILLEDMNHYASVLSPGGLFLLSGFYLSDLDAIRASALASGLYYQSHLEKETWVAAVFEKPE